MSLPMFTKSLPTTPPPPQFTVQPPEKFYPQKVWPLHKHRLNIKPSLQMAFVVKKNCDELKKQSKKI